VKDKQTVYKCDVCEKEVILSESNPHFGGSPLNAWIHLDRHATVLNATFERHFDVCSTACLKKLAKKLDN